MPERARARPSGAAQAAWCAWPARLRRLVRLEAAEADCRIVPSLGFLALVAACWCRSTDRRRRSPAIRARAGALRAPPPRSAAGSSPTARRPAPCRAVAPRYARPAFRVRRSSVRTAGTTICRPRAAARCPRSTGGRTAVMVQHRSTTRGIFWATKPRRSSSTPQRPTTRSSSQASETAHYRLARAYIAAQLNSINGAPFPDEVARAFEEATVLFLAADPAQLEAAAVARFEALADLLDDFNAGSAGPGAATPAGAVLQRRCRQGRRGHGDPRRRDGRRGG